MLDASVASEAFVGLGVGVLLDALEAEHAEDAVGAGDRHAEPRLRIGATDLHRSGGSLVVQCADSDRASGSDHLRGHPRTKRPRVAVEAFTFVDVVRPRDQVRRRIVQGDEARPRSEERRDAVADELDDGVELELIREGAADLVDQAELGVALTGLLERPDAGQGRPDVLADEGEQVTVGVRVVLVVRVRLAGDDADGSRVGPERSPQPIALPHDADRFHLALGDELPVVSGRDDRRPSGPQDVGRRAAGVPDAERLPDRRIRKLDVDGVDVVREVDRLAPVVIERDVEVLGEHQARDGRVDLAVERLEILGGRRGLGNPVEGRLDLFRSGVLRIAQLEPSIRARSASSPATPGCSSTVRFRLGMTPLRCVAQAPGRAREGEHSVRLALEHAVPS